MQKDGEELPSFCVSARGSALAWLVPEVQQAASPEDVSLPSRLQTKWSLVGRKQILQRQLPLILGVGPLALMGAFK